VALVTASEAVSFLTAKFSPTLHIGSLSRSWTHRDRYCKPSQYVLL